MSEPGSFLGSSIGRKLIMAFTGLILFGYVIAHMLGNLQVFQGPERLNAYAAALHRLGPLLWVARLVLLAAVGLHIWSAYSLTMSNRSARGRRYQRFDAQSATWASRTMRWSGVLLALFVVYHLLHFTVGTPAVHPQFVPGDAYHNVVTGFQNPLVAAFYIVAMLALGLHLLHGAWSILQTTGLSHPWLDRTRYGLAAVITAVIVIGFIAVPLGVMAGMLSEGRLTRPLTAAGSARPPAVGSPLRGGR